MTEAGGADAQPASRRLCSGGDLLTFAIVGVQGFPVQLPTFVARMLAFKLSIDTSKLPAVGDLLRSMAR